jgi:hypothetical protein
VIPAVFGVIFSQVPANSDGAAPRASGNPGQNPKATRHNPHTANRFRSPFFIIASSQTVGRIVGRPDASAGIRTPGKQPAILPNSIANFQKKTDE